MPRAELVDVLTRRAHEALAAPGRHEEALLREELPHLPGRDAAVDEDVPVLRLVELDERPVRLRERGGREEDRSEEREGEAAHDSLFSPASRGSTGETNVD